MALFVSELGMTPGEVIERATRRSAKFLGLADQIGTVEEGKIADLVLLDANPLDDIHNTKRISAVILRGTLYDQRGIKRILSDVRAAPDIRIDDWGRTSSVRNP
jgi:imidazolonepropionase-like amidohydrolase